MLVSMVVLLETSPLTLFFLKYNCQTYSFAKNAGGWR